MSKLTEAEIVLLADKIKASSFSSAILFMLESHWPLKNLLVLGLDFTAPLFYLFRQKEIDIMRSLLSDSEGLQTLIRLLEE